MNLDFLFIGAHPDDVELSCGGTVAAVVDMGYTAGILDLTYGEMGTRGTRETRMQEAKVAADILGVTYRHTLDLGDTILDNNRENQLQIIQQVRLLKPKICIINAPYDRHPDHGKGSLLTTDALFYSGLRKIETLGENGEPQEPWRPQHTLHYMQDRSFKPDFIFDITKYWEHKKKSVIAYHTQFNVTNPGDEPETYISSTSFFEMIEGRARYFGHMGGFDYGEPFKYFNRPTPVQSFDFLINSKPKR